MAAPEIDFRALAGQLLSRARELLPQWYPAGKIRGQEFLIGDVTGTPGKSLSVSLKTGIWADFAGKDKGGDLIALYAAKEGIGQADAAKRLTNGETPTYQTRSTFKTRSARLGQPQSGSPPPNFTHRSYGLPTFTWAYLDAKGAVIYYMARYDPPSETKQFVPYSWAPDKGEWVKLSPDKPRPLYGLDQLAKYPTKPVMLVEGEKAADAARTIAGNPYVVVTWSNGAVALGAADLTPLHGRALLLWPDADEPGITAMDTLGQLLITKAASIKVVDIRGQPLGWDIADAVAAEWTWPAIVKWAKPRTHPWRAPLAPQKDPPAAGKSNVVDLSTGEPVSPQDILGEASWDALNLSRPPRGGYPPANLDTMLRILEGHKHAVGLVSWDDFYQRMIHRDGHEWSEADDTALTVWIQREIGIPKASSMTVREAVVLFSMAHRINAPKTWLDGLKWDDTERLKTFFTDSYGTPQNDYTQAAGRNFWVSMIARVYQPGCKVDNMVVLEGPQDIGKSRSLAVIGGAWYAEASESVMTKDFFQVLPGKMIIEVAELDAFSRAEITRVKQVITCQSDRYRPSYGRRAIDMPRMSIFVGTTNEDVYLRDQTGGRRFWPIKCQTANMEYIAAQREQLFAEAVAAFKAGATWWQMPRTDTLVEQARRRVADVWEETLAPYLEDRLEVSMSRVLSDGLGLPAAKMDRILQLRAATVLRTLGYERITASRQGVSQKLWVRKPKPGDQKEIDA